MTAILIMSRNSRSCESVLTPEATPKPPQATTKPYSRHILGIYSGVQSHLKATPRPPQSHLLGSTEPPQSHPKATLMRPPSQVHATYKPGDWEVPSYSHGILMVFSSYFPRVLWWNTPRRHSVSTEPRGDIDSIGLVVIQRESCFPTPIFRRLTFFVLLPLPVIQSFSHDRHATQGSTRQRTSA